MSLDCSTTTGGQAQSAVDFTFLAAQTFGDRLLQRELLELFLDQTRRQLPHLAGSAPRAASDTAHLLRGSCLGIGAWRAAEAAQAFEDAAGKQRASLYAPMVAAFAATEAAICAHLASL